ncbi:MAG: DUF11 domain-containing protein [Actinobacteria bacterium]|nr:DUF11 domain-containing protein [Actinomycetota bacterium]
MSFTGGRKIAAAAAIVFLLAGCMLFSGSDRAAAGDISWSEYPGNPVYDPPAGRAYYPCVIYDPNRFSSRGASYYYKMWYGDTDSSPYEWVVYSDDGINWENPTALTGIVAVGYHAKILYLEDGYGAGPYYYKIWYWDSTPAVLYSINAIRTADSTDGVNWVNDQALTQDATYSLVDNVGDDWNRGSYGPVAMLHNPSASNTGGDPFDYTFAMYYDGTTGGQEVIGLGYSADGNHWTRYGDDPVLDHGNPGDWDSDYATNGTVIPGDDGTWRMWYSGSGPAGGGNEGVGYATSSDGINWTRDPDNPLISIYDGVAWRDVRTYTPSVLYNPGKFDGHGDASLYKMWFTGRTNTPSTNYAIGYMGSNDPNLTLSKQATPPGTVTRGSVITYTLRAGNNGGAPATGCSLADDIPEYTSYVSATTTLNGAPVADAGGTSPLAGGMAVNSPGEAAGVIAVGEEAVVTFTVQVGNDLPLGATVSNTATASSEGTAAAEATSDNPTPPDLPPTWYFAEGSTQAGFDEYILLSNMGDTDMTVTITYITEGGDESDFQYLVPAQSRSTVYVNAAVPGEAGVAAIVTGEEGLICERSMYYVHNGIAGGDDVIGTNAPSIDLFFAEGFTGTPESPFEEWLLLLNPNPDASGVTIDYLFPGGETDQKVYSVPGRRRISINVDSEVGEGREVSARIRSELPVVAERAMYFEYNGVWPGGHNGVAATGARNDWYLAEGYTGWEGSQFDEWILVANENDQPASVTVTYMFPDGSTQAVEHTAAARSRMTVSADAEVGQGQMVSAHVHSDVPVVVERAMYFDYRNTWQGGHNCLGATTPARELYFAEGYTGNPSSQFETWVLIQNTADEAKTARVDYILMTGEVIGQELELPALSRTTVSANQVLGQENLEFSMRVTSVDGTPVLLAERAMYFSYNGPMGGSQGGHDVVGY